MKQSSLPFVGEIMYEVAKATRILPGKESEDSSTKLRQRLRRFSKAEVSMDDDDDMNLNEIHKDMVDAARQVFNLEDSYHEKIVNWLGLFNHHYLAYCKESALFISRKDAIRDMLSSKHIRNMLAMYKFNFKTDQEEEHPLFEALVYLVSELKNTSNSDTSIRFAMQYLTKVFGESKFEEIFSLDSRDGDVSGNSTFESWSKGTIPIAGSLIYYGTQLKNPENRSLFIAVFMMANVIKELNEKFNSLFGKNQVKVIWGNICALLVHDQKSESVEGYTAIDYLSNFKSDPYLSVYEVLKKVSFRHQFSPEDVMQLEYTIHKNSHVIDYLEPIIYLNEGRFNLMQKKYDLAFKAFYAGFQASICGHGLTARLLNEYGLMVGAYLKLAEKKSKVSTRSLQPLLKELRAWSLLMNYDSCMWVDNELHFVEHCYKMFKKILGDMLGLKQEEFETIRSFDKDKVNSYEEFILRFKVDLTKPDQVIDTHECMFSQLSFCCRQASDYEGNDKVGSSHDQSFSLYVQQLLEAGADVNYRNEIGRTLFHELVNEFNSRIDLVSLVFETNMVDIGKLTAASSVSEKSAFNIILENIPKALPPDRDRLLNAMALYPDLLELVNYIRGVIIDLEPSSQGGKK